MYHSIIFTGKRWKPLKWPLMNEWLNEMLGIDTMAYCPVFKGKEILSPATIWMKLEDVMLNEIS